MLLMDGYKLDHRRQYPKGTQYVYSNWTPRSSRIAGQNEVVLFGLQYFLKRYLMDYMDEFLFSRPKNEIEEEYSKRVNGYIGPNSIGTKHIAALHELGYVPLAFRALKEGTLCPLRVPMLTVENTHPEFFWLVNYFETLMSSILWMPCTSATTSFRMRKLLNDYVQKTGGNSEFVQWQGHDFSMRGMAGLEAATMSGAGHLLSFTGTDTIPAIEFIEKYYGGDNGLIGGSVAATEHSVMSAGGELGERETFDRLLDLYPEGIVSVVSDTWNLWDVILKILPSLKEKILSRNGKLVIRPDSGDPVKIICGDSSKAGIYSLKEPVRKGVVELLWEIFGGTVNADGYKELDPHIGVIYGDAITYDRCQKICERLKEKGFASTNMVYGIGSYTYQYTTRDVYGFAMKATWVKIDGKDYDLFKKPVTDDGEKFSAIGRLAVLKNNLGILELINKATPSQQQESELGLMWENGKFLRKQSFQDVRSTLWRK